MEEKSEKSKKQSVCTSFFDTSPSIHLNQINIAHLTHMFHSLMLLMKHKLQLQQKQKKLYLIEWEKSKKEMMQRYLSFQLWISLIRSKNPPNGRVHMNYFDDEVAIDNNQILKFMLIIISQLFLKRYSPCDSDVTPQLSFFKFVSDVFNECDLDVEKFLHLIQFNDLCRLRIYDLRLLVFQNEIKERILKYLFKHHKHDYERLIERILGVLDKSKSGELVVSADSSICSEPVSEFEFDRTSMAPKKRRKHLTPDLRDFVKDNIDAGSPGQPVMAPGGQQRPEPGGGRREHVKNIEIIPWQGTPRLFDLEYKIKSQNHWNVNEPLYCVSANENLSKVARDLAGNLFLIRPKSFDLREEPVLQMKMMKSTHREFEVKVMAFYVKLHFKMVPFFESMVNSNKNSPYFRSKKQICMNYPIKYRYSGKKNVLYLLQSENFEFKFLKITQNEFIDLCVLNKQLINSIFRQLVQ